MEERQIVEDINLSVAVSASILSRPRRRSIRTLHTDPTSSRTPNPRKFGGTRRTFINETRDLVHDSSSIAHRVSSGREPSASIKHAVYDKNLNRLAHSQRDCECSPRELRRRSKSDAREEKSKDKDEESLMATMARRLSMLEQLVGVQRAQLELKDKEIDVLSRKNMTMRNSSDGSNDSLSRAQRESSQLRRQIEEMDKFLSDYGLTWAGYRAPFSSRAAERAIPESSASLDSHHRLRISKSSAVLQKSPRASERKSLSRQVSSKTAPLRHSSAQPKSAIGVTSRESASDRHRLTRDHPSRRDLETIEGSTPELEGLIYFDIASMLSTVEHLNASAESEIVAKGGIHTFEPPRCESLIIYQNGIFFQNGPLREYTLRTTRDFCNDILDGYFPYELRDEFPEGLHFDVVDCSALAFDPLLYTNANGIGSKHALNSTRAAQLSPRYVVSNLPEKVIHGGKVIEIRPSASPKLALPKAFPSPRRRLGLSTCVTLESEAVTSMNGKENEKVYSYHIQCIFDKRIESSDAITRDPTPKDTYLVNVLPSDTIGTLRDLLKKATSNSTTKTTASTSTCSGDQFYVALSQVERQRTTDDKHSPRIRICQRFPNFEFKNNSVTVAEAGLSRNHTLYCSVVDSPS